MSEHDPIITQAIEDTWMAKLSDLDEARFVEFLEEMYSNTTVPSLKATLKVAVAHITKKTKDLPKGIALG